MAREGTGGGGGAIIDLDSRMRARPSMCRREVDRILTVVLKTCWHLNLAQVTCILSMVEWTT